MEALHPSRCQPLKKFFRRFSAHGDFWHRYLYWGTRHCPWFLEPMYVFAFTVMFWVFLGRVRRAVAANLGVLLPGSSPFMNQLRAFRVFWNFAWTMVDQAHVRHGEDCITWEVFGDGHLARLEAQKDGSILLTAHMGNYDVAAPLFARRIQRPIHMVRAPERQRENQEFHQKHREKEQRGAFVVHYNEPGNMLGVELARAIHDGGVVAIQGDRVLFDVSPMELPFREGVEWRIPRGPFLLSLVARAFIHPVFIVRMGYRRYGVLAFPPIKTEVNPDTRDKEVSQRQAALEWVSVLRGVMERHWRQWFVFEPVFQKQTEAAPAAVPLNSEPESRKPDKVMPSKSGRSPARVYTTAGAAGAWTALVVLRWLMAGAWGCTACLAAALLLWPLIWFLGTVALAQVSLWVALAVMKLARLPSRAYELLANSITLAALSGIGWTELRSGCPMGWWLGVAWFAGLAVSLVRALFR